MNKRTPRNVLVVGSAGFIGKHVVLALEASRVKVTGMDIAGPPADMQHINWITASISDDSMIAAAVNNFDTVIFLANASLPGSAQVNFAGEIRSHVEMTIKAAEICNKLGVERFLFASSGGTIYGYSPPNGSSLREDNSTYPKNAYGASKLAIEHFLRLISSSGPMSALSLRISNPYGEGQRAIRAQGVVAAAMQHAIEGTRMPIWGDGSVERDFIHVSDVANAFVLAAASQTNCHVLNIGSGKGISISEILRLVGQAVGRPLIVDYEPGRTIDVQRNVLDIGRAECELGWKPKVDIELGLLRTAEWWKRLRLE